MFITVTRSRFLQRSRLLGMTRCVGGFPRVLALGVVPLLQLASAENGERQSANEIRGGQDPEDYTPPGVGLILVGDHADHQSAEVTAQRAQGVRQAEYRSRKIWRDVQTVAEITGRDTAVYCESSREYDDGGHTIAAPVGQHDHQ